MRRGLSFVSVCLFGVVLAGCGGGAPEPASGDAAQDAATSGAQAAPPGVDANMAQQAAQEFYQTGQVSPEVRKQFEAASQKMYGGQYPGAQQRPPQR